MAEEAARAGALADVRVLDLTEEIGLYCTKLLADLGADVIKVEPPGGDAARRIGPFYHDEPDPEKSLAYFFFNTSKRSITLNLEEADGRALLRRLLPTADVVVESFAPGYLSGLGLGYDDLTKIKPDIILASITGFGQWGPHAHYKAPDIVGVAMGGIMWLAGEPEDPPNRPYGNQGYISASVQAAQGILIALYHRDLTGEGQQVDVSMQEALSIAQETAIQSWDMNQQIRRRIGDRRILGFPVPGVGLYECKDGHLYGYVGAPGGAPWPDLLQWMVDEGLAEDLNQEPYASTVAGLNLGFLTTLLVNPERVSDVVPQLEHIEDVLQRFLLSKTKLEAYEGAQKRRILLGMASTPKDIVESPQLRFRHYFQDVHHDQLDDTLTYPGPPYRLSETPAVTRRRPPRIGEHNVEVYCGELGLSKEELAALEAAGAI
jgi:crotonobetainyl-CoA:carnitine CoA-transferase CaiB-like acyl-CoA transferase